MKTKIVKCSCSHVYQDKKYGQGKRVHNRMPAKDKGGAPRWRCTVCGNETMN